LQDGDPVIISGEGIDRFDASFIIGHDSGLRLLQ
jgi:hypothetical protein